MNDEEIYEEEDFGYEESDWDDLQDYLEAF